MREISAGGVVYRKGVAGLEIQLIQDRSGKIALPKGKMEAGETIAQTALREIKEETGIVGRIEAPLARTDYQYKTEEHGIINKEVHYFLVEAIGGSMKVQVEEIRGAEWLMPQQAWAKQIAAGYSNNDSVVRKALQYLGVKGNLNEQL